MLTKLNQDAKSLFEPFEEKRIKLILFWLAALFVFAFGLSLLRDQAGDFFPAWFGKYSLQIFLAAALISLFSSGWRPQWWGDQRGIVLFLTFVVGYFILLFILNFIASAQMPEFSVRHFTNRTWEQILFTAVVAPIFEELFFRDALFRALGRRFDSAWIAILFSSAFFMIAHLSLYSGAFLLGLVSCLILVYSRSILACIAFHSLSNLSYFFLPVWFPGLFRWLIESGWFEHFYR